MNGQQTVGFPFQNALEYFMINPITSWQRFFNPQFFITNNYEDEQVENHVLRRAGSYGKQLGQIIDVLDVLVSLVNPHDQHLTPQERLALAQFDDLHKQVKSAVAEVRGTRASGITLADVERLVDDLESLARLNPAAARRLRDRLESRLAVPPAGDPGAPPSGAGR